MADLRNGGLLPMKRYGPQIEWQEAFKPERAHGCPELYFKHWICVMCIAAAAEKKLVIHNATTVAGQSVLLQCVMPVQRDVVWLHVTDGLPLPVHTTDR